MSGCVSTAQVPLSEEELGKASEAPDKLAIGVEGGFQVDAKKYRVEKEYALALMPARLRVELPCPELPELVLRAITSVQVGREPACTARGAGALPRGREPHRRGGGLARQAPPGRCVCWVQYRAPASRIGEWCTAQQ